MENLESMTKPQLAAAYNELADKLGRPPTRRMESREAGIRRVRALLLAVGEQESPSANGTAQGKFLVGEPEPEQDTPKDRTWTETREAPTHASAAADTWKDEDVRAARAMRHKVEVGGVEYRSVSAAFKALRLPLAKHSPFRGALVKAGTLDFEGHTFKVLS